MDVERKARVIAMGSQKGGVGKTTNTVHIARALAERGSKVLIIDLDMSAGATRHFGVTSEAHPGSYEMLAGEEEAPNLILTREDEDVGLSENLHLIPAARKLEGINQALAQKSNLIPVRELLRQPLESLRGQYDYILLDTAPTATTPTIASYLAADYLILSATPDPFAIAGQNDALGDISAAQQNNPNLIFLGVVLSRVDKRTRPANPLSRFMEKSFQVGGDAESMKFKTSIGRCTVIPQTQMLGKTLFETHPTHSVTVAYRALAREIEERRAKLEGRAETRSIANGKAQSRR